MGYFPHESNCRLYHVCLPFGQAGQFRHWEFECGPGTVFSPRRTACVHATPKNLRKCSGGS